MQAIILAGGKGTRLAPYTALFPKPLMPLGDMPILEIIIRQLEKYGFTDIVLTVGHLAELIQAFFNHGKKFGVKISYIREDKPLGTVGSVALIDNLDADFLVVDGDILTDLSFSSLLSFHKNNHSLITIAANKREMKINYGIVEYDADHELKKFTEKPTLDYEINMGVYVMSREVVNYIKPHEKLDIPELIDRAKVEDKKVSIYCHEGYWMDIGNSNDYAQAQNDFEKKREMFL